MSHLKAPPRILIVDDYPDIGDMFAAVLSKRGYSIETATNGEQALEIYQKAREQGRPFDLLILDLALPGISGIMVSEAVRAMGDQVKIAFLTAHSDDPMTGARGAIANVVGIWRKPIEAARLQANVACVLGDERVLGRASK